MIAVPANPDRKPPPKNPSSFKIKAKDHGSVTVKIDKLVMGAPAPKKLRRYLAKEKTND